MKLKYILLFAVAGVIVASSCSKKKEDPAPATTTSSTTSTTSTTSTSSTTTPAPSANSIKIVSGSQNDSTFSLQLNFAQAKVSSALTTIDAKTDPAHPTAQINIVCDNVVASNGDSFRVTIDMGINNTKKAIYTISSTTQDNNINIQFDDLNKHANRTHLNYGVQYGTSSASIDLLNNGAIFDQKEGGSCIGRFSGYFTYTGDDHYGITIPAGSGLFSTKVTILK